MPKLSSFWGAGWTCQANILLDNDRKDRALEIIEQGTAIDGIIS